LFRSHYFIDAVTKLSNTSSQLHGKRALSVFLTGSPSTLLLLRLSLPLQQMLHGCRRDFYHPLGIDISVNGEVIGDNRHAASHSLIDCGTPAFIIARENHHLALLQRSEFCLFVHETQKLKNCALMPFPYQWFELSAGATYYRQATSFPFFTDQFPYS